MSVQKRVLPSGRKVYVVRWVEVDKHRARNFARKADAEAFEAEVKRQSRLAELGLPDPGAGRITLAEFAREWWAYHAEPNLATATRRHYAELFDRHVLQQLGGLELRELTPDVIEDFAADLKRSGVGDPTVRKTLALVQSVLARAVARGRIPRNPVAAIRKPPQRRARPVSPPSLAAVEQLRAELRDAGRLRDATLVCVLAYAGLRPGEALGLRWREIGERTLTISGSVVLGEEKTTKTGGHRSVRLLTPLAADLAEWRLASGRRTLSVFVFPRSDGRHWCDTDWRNWRRRVYVPNAVAVGIERPRPYDLRHLFVSLLLAEGANVVEVARQAGHAPSMSLDTYGHVIEELAGVERVSANDAIRRARTAGQAKATARGFAR